jgi:hypothetical protein
MFNLDCLMLIPCCVSVRTIQIVAPVRYPVVQISCKLHIMKLKEKENIELYKRRGKRQKINELMQA